RLQRRLERAANQSQLPAVVGGRRRERSRPGEIRVRGGLLPAGGRLSARLSGHSLRGAVHRIDLHGTVLVGTHLGYAGSPHAVRHDRRRIVGVLPGIDGAERAPGLCRVLYTGRRRHDAVAFCLLQRCIAVAFGGRCHRGAGRSLLFFALSSRAVGGLCLAVRCACDIFPARDHHDRHPQTRLVPRRRGAQVQVVRSSVAIVGAGAIGCWLADALDRAGWAVSMLARGPTLAALQSDGLTVERGGETRHSRPRAGSAPELGIHDYLFLTVKAQALPDLAPSLSALVGPSTVVISGTNGIPWWFFHDFGGILANQVLESVDPEQSPDRTFPRQSVLGSAVHA